MTTLQASTHIYILGFSDGVVKVGRSRVVSHRITNLITEASYRGAEVVARWSREIANADVVESRLIGQAHQLFAHAWGREYFIADFYEFLAMATRYLTLEDIRGGEVDLSELPTSLRIRLEGLTERSARRLSSLPTERTP